jgi:hypothetical protein
VAAAKQAEMMAELRRGMAIPLLYRFSKLAAGLAQEF